MHVVRYSSITLTLSSMNPLLDEEIIDISGIPRVAPVVIDDSSQVTVAPLERTERPRPKPDLIVLNDSSSDEHGDEGFSVTKIKPARRPVLDRGYRRTNYDVHPVDLTKVQTPTIQRRPAPHTERVWPGARNFAHYLAEAFNPLINRRHDQINDLLAEDFPGWRRRPIRRPVVPPPAPAPALIPVPQVEEPEEEPGKRVVLSEVRCPVCFDPVTTPASTICGHIFCFNCIKLSQQAQKQCPVCRTKLNPKQIYRLFM